MNRLAVADRLGEDRMGEDAAPDKPTDRADRTADVFVEERPWGDFQSFVTNERVTVKVITVEPGRRLSLQTHDHRAEMWQVLDGPLDVTVGERSWRAQRGELVWVPQGALHRLGNSEARPGRILEVGFGQFDESDIVRHQDDFSR